jgi:hypothetical protein
MGHLTDIIKAIRAQHRYENNLLLCQMCSMEEDLNSLKERRPQTKDHSPETTMGVRVLLDRVIKRMK